MENFNAHSGRLADLSDAQPLREHLHDLGKYRLEWRKHLSAVSLGAFLALNCANKVPAAIPQ